MKQDHEYDRYYSEKRLDKLKKKGFALEQILIVDDSPEKARSNYGNAIYIRAFTGDPNDQELQYLYNYLLTLKTVDNVRTIENVAGETFLYNRNTYPIQLTPIATQVSLGIFLPAMLALIDGTVF